MDFLAVSYQEIYLLEQLTEHGIGLADSLTAGHVLLGETAIWDLWYTICLYTVAALVIHVQPISPVPFGVRSSVFVAVFLGPSNLCLSGRHGECVPSLKMSSGLHNPRCT